MTVSDTLAQPTRRSAVEPHPPPIVRLDTSLESLAAYTLAHADEGAPVLATVVATEGSTYRKSGARMVVLPDGRYQGLLSGGCLEGDLRYHADEVRVRGAPKLVAYDPRESDDALFGLGSGCEGAMRILLESAGRGSPAAAALARTAAASQSGSPAVLVIVYEGGSPPAGTHLPVPPLPPVLISAAARALELQSSSTVALPGESGDLRALIDYIAPPPNLLICGAGPDAVPLVAVVRALGWHATVIDHRPAYADAAQFPGAEVLCAAPGSLRTVLALERFHAAVVMSHHLNSDQMYLAELALSAAPGYIGLLGPKIRRDRLLQQLGAATSGLESRLHSPVGLDLGAVTPEGIALAIAGEIHAWLAGRQLSIGKHASTGSPRSS